MKESFIHYLFRDHSSLEDYFNKCQCPDFRTIRRRLFLLLRAENTRIPDHYYKAQKSYEFDGQGSLYKLDGLDSLLTTGLENLVSKHLKLKNSRIYVKQEMQLKWQNLITYISPLVLQSAFLSQNVHGFSKNERKSIREFYREYVYPNFRYTALPYPYVPQIEYLAKREAGFCDLHMHINGTTEVDKVWQTFLMKPMQTYKDLSTTYRSSDVVKEQLFQEAGDLSPQSLYELLIIAQSIRNILFEVYQGDEKVIRELNRLIQQGKRAKFLQYLKDSVTNRSTAKYLHQTQKEVYHPFAQLVFDKNPLDVDKKLYLSLEGLMLSLMFNYVKRKKQVYLSVAHLLHYYLLILGVTNRLLVQQVNQFGFTQFQKITLNDLREETESYYADRFFQLHGNDQRNIRYLEGRFSPKSTDGKNNELLNRINKGWKSFLNQLSTSQGIEQPKLALIAHFIKKKDNTPNPYIRFKELRKELSEKADVLIYTINKDLGGVANNIVGVDAASSELDTPPEVFAPIFRRLRRAGIKHFTFHAGEDFYHVVSGLRSVYEAIEFCGLQHGDRIGHATATGIDINHWVQNVGSRIYMSKGEYLDNLVFVYHFIRKEKIDELKKLIPGLVHTISCLHQEIYGIDNTLSVIEQAWLMRRYCPILIQAACAEEKYTHVQSLIQRAHHVRGEDTFESHEWSDICTHVFRRSSREVIDLFLRYHNRECSTHYQKIIPVTIGEILSVDDMVVIQKALLSYMHHKEIVIETLPTSNVRISHSYGFDTYHLWNWLKWRDEGALIPPLVIGTDDAGIFATNIYNEYANLYCYLTGEHHVTHTKALQIVENLNKNAHIYKFDN